MGEFLLNGNRYESVLLDNGKPVDGLFWILFFFGFVTLVFFVVVLVFFQDSPRFFYVVGIPGLIQLMVCLLSWLGMPRGLVLVKKRR